MDALSSGVKAGRQKRRQPDIRIVRTLAAWLVRRQQRLSQKNAQKETEHNPDDTHGVTNDMTKDQLNALIEYIKVF